MIPSLRAELKKVLTVRSTYAITLFFLILLGIIAFYGHGYKEDANSTLFLSGTLTSTATIASFAGALVALLLMAHEYRYNTITYTLTSANRRSKVLLAKLLVVIGLVFIYALIVTVLALSLTKLGASMAHHTMPPQDINYLAYFAKTAFFAEAYALTGLLIPTLVRNMQASVAVLFIVPNNLEALLGLLIKQPEKWLPYTALAQVIEPPVKNVGGHGGNLVSPVHGAVVFLIYIAAFWLIAWYLFVKRDSS